MKVLYIVTQGDLGGAQKYVLTLAKHFGGEIAAGDTNQELFQTAQTLGIQTYPLKHLKRNIHPYHDFLAVWELLTLIRRTKPTIVHLNSSKVGLLGSIVGKLAGVKVVFTAHGFFFFENTPLLHKFCYIFLEKFASQFRDFIITVSDHDRLNALKYRIITSERIKTIHNGIEPINFLSREEARTKLNLRGEFAIGNIAQYYHRKGLDILINAVGLLPNAIKEKIKVVLIGEGPEKKNLSDLIKQLNLESQIHLYGNLVGAARYLKAFDLFVLSSRVEGFPYVLLEAMQAQLPIIATDVGGNKEAVGQSALIIAPNDPELLSSAVVQSYKSPQINQSSSFTEQEMLTKTTQVYHNI